MNESYRECHICTRSFPYSEMAKKEKLDWGKFIYYCDECFERKSRQEKTDSGSYFSRKYSNMKGKSEWWDD